MLQFQGEINTSLCLDIVMWSSGTKALLLIELTVPWGEEIEAAFERMRLKYSDLVSECKKAGWRTTIYPVEVGWRGFVGTSTACLLSGMGVTGPAECPEKIWLKRQRKATFGFG